MPQPPTAKPVVVSPSDRAKEPPVSGYGVDTIALRAPTTEGFFAALTTLRIKEVVHLDTGEIERLVSSGQIIIRVGEAWVSVYADYRNGGPEVRIEFSAPTVLDGHNCEPLPLRMLPEVVDTVLNEIRRHLTGVPAIKDFRLIRIDIVRDFRDVASIDRTLHGLSSLPVTWATQNDHLQKGITREWQTFTRGSPSQWTVRGYGKSAQLQQLAQRDDYRHDLLLKLAGEAVGVLRWELELHADVLKKNGLRTLLDLSPHAVHKLTTYYFERSRFGDIFSGFNRLHDIVQELRATGRAPEARGLVTYLTTGLLGTDDLYCFNQNNQYKKLAREYSLTPDDVIGHFAPHRLDFAMGRELWGEAAQLT